MARRIHTLLPFAVQNLAAQISVGKLLENDSIIWFQTNKCFHSGNFNNFLKNLFNFLQTRHFPWFFMSQCWSNDSLAMSIARACPRKRRQPSKNSSTSTEPPAVVKRDTADATEETNPNFKRKKIQIQTCLNGLQKHALGLRPRLRVWKMTTRRRHPNPNFQNTLWQLARGTVLGAFRKWWFRYHLRRSW